MAWLLFCTGNRGVQDAQGWQCLSWVTSQLGLGSAILLAESAGSRDRSPEHRLEGGPRGPGPEEQA